MSSLFQHESVLWQKGYTVIGVDEVGRGAFAGPLIAAACAFTPKIRQLVDETQSTNIKICDSKLLNSAQRERTHLWIQKHCLAYSISSIDVTIINDIGVAKANIIALRTAVLGLINQLQRKTQIFVLSDYFRIPYLKGVDPENQRGIVHGDSISFSIAAASIAAKVERDNLMKKLSNDYQNYQWHQNKGYGTAFHRSAIKEYGATKLHRNLFIRNCV